MTTGMGQQLDIFRLLPGSDASPEAVIDAHHRIHHVMDAIVRQRPFPRKPEAQVRAIGAQHLHPVAGGSPGDLHLEANPGSFCGSGTIQKPYSRRANQ